MARSLGRRQENRGAASSGRTHSGTFDAFAPPVVAIGVGASFFGGVDGGSVKPQDRNGLSHRAVLAFFWSTGFEAARDPETVDATRTKARHPAGPGLLLPAATQLFWDPNSSGYAHGHIKLGPGMTLSGSSPGRSKSYPEEPGTVRRRGRRCGTHHPVVSVGSCADGCKKKRLFRLERPAANVH